LATNIALVFFPAILETIYELATNPEGKFSKTFSAQCKQVAAKLNEPLTKNRFLYTNGENRRIGSVERFDFEKNNMPRKQFFS